MDKINSPANKSAVAAGERKRIPMSVPVSKLTAPDLPGYHLHWFNDTPERIARAVQAGYEFVESGETSLNQAGLGNDSTTSGNTDLGSRVSVVSGEVRGDGQAGRLVLMKIKQEWWEEDQKTVQARNQLVADALTSGTTGKENDGPGDTKLRYTGKANTIPAMFNPHKAKKVVAS